MAGTGSFARGDQPRSVPDPYGAAYDAMIVKQRAHNARQEAAIAQRRAKAAAYWSSHPGLVESAVPVWGSAREAVADYREGDMVGAAANGALALTDLTGEGYVLKTLGKGGLRFGRSNAWKATRDWMGPEKKALLEAEQHGHHWLIPRNQWGKNVPDVIKNQPWNIKGMASPELHMRMRSGINGKPRLNALERYVHGTPAWWKVQNGVWAANAAVGAEEGLNPAARNDQPGGSSAAR